MLRLVCALVTLAGTAFAAEEKAPVAAGEKTPKRYTHGADCQLCYEGASGLELAVPLWLPIVGIEG
ncbi:MAG TPA: hypothetical protein VF103_12080, partial [Polyangiaceae bacterium]